MEFLLIKSVFVEQTDLQAQSIQLSLQLIKAHKARAQRARGFRESSISIPAS
jgi:hypothetical protein